MTTPHLPTAEQLIEVCEATWPPAETNHVGAWVVRNGAGGGKRVSAATENWPTTEADLPTAEKAMRDIGMDPLFQIRAGDEHLDDMLEQHGYDIIDPVNIWVIPVSELTDEPLPPVSAFAIWPMLSIMTELWDEGGISEHRRAVMERADCPKTALLARTDDTPAGVGFVGIHNGIAMAHALHVDPKLRRMGTGQNLLKQAAKWAEEQGAEYLSLIVTQGNHAANPLYANLGMHLVGHYHYRVKR
ncbi:Acetyltransferase (GNAT) family protein [Aliiroseovarius halocynthiae]|uniref:GNAT family N-acetyltransferase n=1 Tax=Aliiroseovarius halocynthiae TaxID=985055 RepID=A0A545SZG4_9RHOB|nr:GNAT family N-acetyltransferase [Aliiroseovarius halocynthiae]TQV70365.1 GNAT family N-acetyltransferase [Aliiroseovarius halocynthiae]SMR81938.1 Acetyltransferase (GNAT) family protein [Aliiroseovarius halocynthiae]